MSKPIGRVETRALHTPYQKKTYTENYLAISVVSLAAIGAVVGVLGILASSGFNLHYFNTLNVLTIQGGALLTGIAIPFGLAGGGILIVRSCLPKKVAPTSSDDPGGKATLYQALLELPDERFFILPPIDRDTGLR
ncbi:MAG: hypothetical protein JJU12_01480 [Chlamydiales bacterium]|nr:hypothetical protein [Chlamydiales bacterium]